MHRRYFPSFLCSFSAGKWRKKQFDGHEAETGRKKQKQTEPKEKKDVNKDFMSAWNCDSLASAIEFVPIYLLHAVTVCSSEDCLDVNWLHWFCVTGDNTSDRVQLFFFISTNRLNYRKKHLNYFWQTFLFCLLEMRLIFFLRVINFLNVPLSPSLLASSTSHPPTPCCLSCPCKQHLHHVLAAHYRAQHPSLAGLVIFQRHHHHRRGRSPTPCSVRFISASSCSLHDLHVISPPFGPAPASWCKWWMFYDPAESRAEHRQFFRSTRGGGAPQGWLFGSQSKSLMKLSGPSNSAVHMRG